MSAIYYKTMLRHHFEPGKVISTAEVNYGFEAGGFDENFRELLDLILKISKQTGAGFEWLLKFAMVFGSGPLPPNVAADLRVNPLIDLYAIMMGRSGPMVPAAKLRRLHAVSRQCDFGVDNRTIAVRLWEHLYEKVRKDHRPHRPKRLESVFACRDEASLAKYRSTHGMGQIVCRIDASECGLIFPSDMLLLDRIEPDAHYEEALPAILAYWDQQYTDDPLIEVMLQGRILLMDEV